MHKPIEINTARERIDIYEEELEFWKQFWHRMNQFLFNYIDSIILVDILDIFFTKSERKSIKEFDNYVDGISRSAQIAPEEIGINFKRNSKLFW